ncbi:hypothetical protein VDG1235_2237 [Verrucomicrobiia bacterium DG1235]|nr:hypothetical protein VDG1235_2237 [Verrucomicrobiae bacterium DG1235]
MSDGFRYPAAPTANPNNIMKTKLLTLIGALAALCSASSVSAISIADAKFRDIDVFLTDLTKDNPVIAGQFFDIVNDDSDGRDLLGFDPDKHLVTEAVIGFLFAEFSDSHAPVASRLVFDISDYFSTSGVTGSDSLFDGNNAYEVEFNSNVYGAIKGDLLVDIQEDGRVDWSVGLAPQDQIDGVTLKLYSAYLGVNAVARPVPDVGSSAAMLGLALFGFFFVRRRLG